MMETNRSILKNFYSILKGSDAFIRFLLITGVSQFSPVSIFSDLNNLDNITLSSHYGGLVGISQTELEESFAPEIAELQKSRPDIINQIKDWYNGYTWNMKEWVYNPFALLNFMADSKFRNYWFATGTPTFLMKALSRRKVYDVENIQMGELGLSTFEPGRADSSSLLFQTGYLTIKDISPSGQVFTLGFPNREVKNSFLDGLLSAYRQTYPAGSTPLLEAVQNGLSNGDIPGVVSHLNALISSIPYDYWNADTESIFTIITFLTFRFVVDGVYPEQHSSKGRCDLLVLTDKYIYAIELKLDGTAAEALSQIKQKGYLEPYLSDTRKKLAVAVSFSSKQRAVSEYLVEEL